MFRRTDKELIERVFTVIDVATGDGIPLFDVNRRVYVTGHDRTVEIDRVRRKCRDDGITEPFGGGRTPTFSKLVGHTMH